MEYNEIIPRHNLKKDIHLSMMRIKVFIVLSLSLSSIKFTYADGNQDASVVTLDYLVNLPSSHYYDYVLDKIGPRIVLLALERNRLLLQPLELAPLDTAIDVFIECLANDSIKYEYSPLLDSVVPDSIDGQIRLIGTPFPCNYGFTEVFISEDGDYLDAFVFTEGIAERGSYISCVPRYLILMTDNGDEDSKLICSQENTDINKGDVEFFLESYSFDNIVIDKIIDLGVSPSNFVKFILRYQGYN